MKKMLWIAALIAGAATLVVTTVASAGRDAATSSVVISTKTLPKLGTVLVNSKGLTLYMFVPDKQKRVTCVKACAAIWPPAKVAKSAKLIAKGKAKKALLGSDPNPAGGRVVTYNHWPLYTYVSDTRPGQATGQALNLNGGLWYVLSPAGKIIKTKP